MKIVFTRSKNPNFFSKLIGVVDGEWTHCGVVTDVTIPPSNEPLVMHSMWDQGLTLIPLSLFLGRRDYAAYDTDSDFDWALAYQLMAEFNGVTRYGYALVLGHFLKFLGFKEPAWLQNRYAHEMHCAKFILLKARDRGLLKDLDLDKTGPTTLKKAIESNPNFTKLGGLFS